MKTLTLILLTVLLTSFSLAQNHYYYNGEKVPLEKAPEKVLVKFKDEMTLDSKKKAIEINPALKAISKDHIKTGNIAIVEVEKGTTEEALKEITKQIEQDKNVISAQIFFLHEKDSVFQGITDRFVVKIKSPSDYSELERLATETKTTIIEQNQFDKSKYVLSATKTSQGNALEMANYFFETGIFEYAEPEFYRILKRNCVNDPNFSDQWGLQNTGQHSGISGADIDVCSAWEITTGRDVISVAVLDEGVDLNHPDLIDNLLPGFDATGNGSAGAPQGDDAHGTACAGIIAASGNNGTGVAGIAYTSRIIPVRIAFSDANGDWTTNDTWISDAINWSWQNGADILSNSWGGGSPSNQITGAINNAVNNGRDGLGCPVLFAAGNDNGSVSYPATLGNVIAVGALSMCNERKNPNSCDGEDWWGGNYGSELDISAPGVKIYTTDISGADGYESGDYDTDFNGTSSACPHAAGVMALVLSVNRCLTQIEARQVLELSCDKVGSYCYTNTNGNPNGTWNNEMGYGRINAFRAVQYAHSQDITASSNLGGSSDGSNGETFQWILVNSGCPSVAAATYIAYRYEVYRDVTFSYSSSPLLSVSSNGFSAANPNNGTYWAQAINITNTSARLRTFVYNLISTSGQSVGWIPAHPLDVRFSYHVVNAVSTNIFLQNQTVSTGTQVHNAMNTIEAGRNVTNAVPVGDYIVEGDANVTLHGGNSVTLGPGTIIRPGPNGYFEASVERFFTCTQFPMGKKANDDGDFPPVVRNYEAERLNNSLEQLESSSDGSTLIQKTSISLRNYPNPFLDNTTVEYQIDKSELVTISFMIIVADPFISSIIKRHMKQVHTK